MTCIITPPTVIALGAMITQVDTQVAFNTFAADLQCIINSGAGGGGSPSGLATGDLGGSYPAPTVVAVHALAGTLDGVTIGGLIPEPATFTNLSVSGTTVVPTAVATSNGTAIANTAFVKTAIANAAATLVATGGSINGTTIGASSPSTGAFTTLSATGQTTLASATGVTVAPASTSTNALATTAFVQAAILAGGGGPPSGTAGGGLAGLYPNPTVVKAAITSGAIDNTPIGGSTAAAGAFTTLTSSVSATLGGLAYSVTPALGDVSTRIATTLFVNNALAAGATPSGTAGGGLAGSYPNPTVVKAAIVAGTIDSTTIGATIASTGAFTALSAVGITSLATATGVTMPLFDSTANLATTAFVESVLGNLKDGDQISVSKVLATVDLGKVLQYIGPPGNTITLPTATRQGVQITVVSSNAAVTIVPTAPQTFSDLSSAFVVAKSDNVVFTYIGGNWFASNGNSAAFKSQKTTNGYQQLPGGMIFQWGYATAGATSGGSTITFPIAFPNACLNVIASDADTADYAFGCSSLTSANFTLTGGSTGGGTYFAGFAYYFATGY